MLQLRDFKPFRAFSMIEVVVVVIVIGILSAVVIPKMKNSRLYEAADQVTSHMRYTQHLAMVDDKFDLDDSNWYKKRWQIIFENISGSQSYTIFSDKAGGSTGTPSKSEVAKNPQNPSQILSGAMSGVSYSDKEATKEMNLGRKYGISDVVFSNSCSVSNSRRIVFDYIGRPMRGRSNYTSPYQEGRLITEKCTITLVEGSGNNVSIIVEPETGFVYILPRS